MGNMSKLGIMAKPGTVASQDCENPGEFHDHLGQNCHLSAPRETTADSCLRPGVMNTLRSKGKLLVTNHDEPEAVIIPVAEYDALMQIVAKSEAQTESALDELRRSFDERLSILQDRSAADRLQSAIRGGAKLGGKVKAGSGYR